MAHLSAGLLAEVAEESLEDMKWERAPRRLRPMDWDWEVSFEDDVALLTKPQRALSAQSPSSRTVPCCWLAQDRMKCG